MKFSAEEYYTGRRNLEYEVGEEDFEDFITYCNPSTDVELELLQSLGWEGVFKQYKGRNWLDAHNIITITDAENGAIYSVGELFSDWVEDYIEPTVSWIDETIEDYTDFELVGEK